MTEDEARAWCLDTFGTAAVDRLSRFAAMVTLENDRQNLIAPSTISSIWSRHIVDSAQLLLLAPVDAVTWLDVGTGGGFPGFVIALLRDQPMTLAEPRRKRADFLLDAKRAFVLDHVDVVQRRVEQVTGTFDVISARAVSSVAALIGAAGARAHSNSTWLLPRGSISNDDIAVLKNAGLMFHVKHSITDPSSSVLIVKGVPQ